MYTSQTSYHLSACNLQKFAKVADPWFPKWGGANSPGKGHQHTTLPKFPVGWDGGGSLVPHRSTNERIMRKFAKVTDPWSPRWGGANSLGKGRQHTTLPKFPVGWDGGALLCPIDLPMKGSWGRKLADFTFHPFWCDSSCQIWTGRYSINGFEALTTVVFVKRAVMYDLALHNASQPFWLSSGIIIDMHSNVSIPLHLIGAMQWFLSCNRGPTQCIPVQTTNFQMVVDWKFIRSILYACW